MRRRPQVKALPITIDRLAAATHMRRGQPDGVRWEIQARLAGRYTIDIHSVCYRSAGAQDGANGGATRRDAVFGEEIVESAEGFVEGFGGLKLFAFAHERCEQGEVVLGLLL